MEPIDPRWNDPNIIPLTNGPVRAVTPPAVATSRLTQDGQVIEFLLPYPMHIIDNAEWPPIECNIAGCRVKIHKPIPAVKPYEPDGRLGNESPDAFCFIVQIFSAPQQNVNHPNPANAWPIVELLLEWIRVKARHYWLLHGSAGFGALFRGSILAQNIGYTGQYNFASYGPNIMVRPLSKELWLTMAAEITSKNPPPVSEAVFCDALLSVVAGDDLKALLELGIACEIEITQLLDSIARLAPDSEEKADYLNRDREGKFPRFADKLETWTVKLGVQNPKDFTGENIPTDWVANVKELYNVRNKVAHSGKLDNRAARVGNYIMAANALLKYSRSAQKAVGINVYALPTSNGSPEQIIIFRDGQFSYNSPAQRY